MEISIKIREGEDIKKVLILLEKIISDKIEYKLDGWVGITVEVD